MTRAADRFMRELRKWERGGVSLKTIQETQKHNKKTIELEIITKTTVLKKFF